MTPVLVDANILIDITTDDPQWSGWSAAALAQAGQGARLVINPLIYAELSVAHARVETLEALLPEDVFHREHLPWPAAFLAARAYLAYCRRGGAGRASLRDFHIGAHAAIRGYRLLSRDRGRYAGHFPKLQIIAPD